MTESAGKKLFKMQLDDIRALSRNLHSLDIDLSDAATDRKFALAGNFFYIFHAPDNEVYINVRFNEVGNPAHKLIKMLGLYIPYQELYITTPAGQAGTMTILYGLCDPDIFRVIDNRSATIEGIDAIRDELRGDTTYDSWDTEKTVGVAAVEVLAANSNRKAFQVQAKDSNTGTIYIGFSNAVTSTKWVAELQPGTPWMLDDYRGPVYAIATAAGQKLGWGEW